MSGEAQPRQASPDWPRRTFDRGLERFATTCRAILAAALYHVVGGLPRVFAYRAFPLAARRKGDGIQASLGL